MRKVTSLCDPPKWVKCPDCAVSVSTIGPHEVHYCRIHRSAPSLLNALRNLTLLIRGMDTVYQNDAAKWLIGKKSFLAAEKAIRDAEGGN